MLDYAYDAVPTDDLPELPAAARTEALAVIQEQLALGNLERSVVAGAFVYDRKGFASTSALGIEPNSSHRGHGDDIVLQLTIRLDGTGFRKLLEVTTAAHVAEAKAALSLELAEAEAARDALDKRIADLVDAKASL